MIHPNSALACESGFASAAAALFGRTRERIATQTLRAIVLSVVPPVVLWSSFEIQSAVGIPLFQSPHTPSYQVPEIVLAPLTRPVLACGTDMPASVLGPPEPLEFEEPLPGTRQWQQVFLVAKSLLPMVTAELLTQAVPLAAGLHDTPVQFRGHLRAMHHRKIPKGNK